MNGRIVVGKPLYVNPAEKKEDRRVRLEVIYNATTLYNYVVVIFRNKIS